MRKTKETSIPLSFLRNLDIMSKNNGLKHRIDSMRIFNSLLTGEGVFKCRKPKSKEEYLIIRIPKP